MKYVGIPHLQALTEGPNVALDKPIVLIGRHQECDIQIPSRKVSRRHCCLAQVGDHLVVRDLCSTNGVRINGVKILEGNLQPGDELTIGNIRYQLKWGNDSAETHAASVKNGIMAKKAPIGKTFVASDSGEMPVPLPDMSMSQPIPLAKPLMPPGKPKTNGELHRKPGSLEIP